MNKKLISRVAYHFVKGYPSGKQTVESSYLSYTLENHISTNKGNVTSNGNDLRTSDPDKTSGLSDQCGSTSSQAEDIDLEVEEPYTRSRCNTWPRLSAAVGHPSTSPSGWSQQVDAPSCRGFNLLLCAYSRLPNKKNKAFKPMV